MEQDKVTVIIVTHNAMPWANKCFQSLRDSNYPLQTVVFDNASIDETVSYIKQNFPEVFVIESKENLGFGQANNKAIEWAYSQNSDFFYLMNQDAWLLPDTVTQLLKVYTNHFDKNEIGILSPMQITGNGESLDVFLDKYIAKNFENRMISDMYLQRLKPYYEIDFVNAAHWFLPKKTIDEVGGFNPYFFHYGEDNEYVNRIQYQNKKVYLCTESKAVHDGKQQLKKVDYKKFKWTDVEIKILNPAKDELNSILKSYRISIVKNLILGKFKKAKEMYRKYNKIIKEKSVLQDYRKQLLTTGPHFLNLSR